MSNYYTAQVCKNGHLFTAYVEDHRNDLETFCSKCGAQMITKCGSCGTNIRGRSRGEFGHWGDYSPPSYCFNCGNPFPWTSSALEATKDILLLSEAIDSSELATIEDTYRDLIIETPKTQVAAMRFKRLLSKSGKTASDAIYQVMVDVLSEAVRKTVWPDH